MSQPPKKPSKSKKTFSPEWEEEEDHQDNSELEARIREEQEALLFLETVQKQKFQPKDSEQELEKIKNAQRTQKSASRHTIDLHGMTVADAQAYVVRTIHDILSQAKGQSVDIRIITGKGHHSKGRGPQLISEIHHVVESTFRQRIVSIEVSPHELNLGGVYLKGHFDVKLR